jgi:hypothetical protein
MSDMVKRYEASTALRPAEAKKIPALATNYFDSMSEFAEGFTPFVKKGDPTKFSAKALEHYLDEVKTIIIPDGFTPTEQGIDLARWTRDKKYYNPGSPR